MGEVETTADEAVSGERGGVKDRAKEWLINRFREQSEWEVSEVISAAKADGISEPAIKRARLSLNMPPSVKRVSKWWWIWMPANADSNHKESKERGN